jgi:hypothetical protein
MALRGVTALVHYLADIACEAIIDNWRDALRRREGQMDIVELANYRVTSGQETDTHSDIQIIEKLLARVRALQTCEAWLQKQVAERDATIESQRLESSQTIDDLRFALRQALDQRDLWTVKASQLQHTLDN